MLTKLKERYQLHFEFSADIAKMYADILVIIIPIVAIAVFLLAVHIIRVGGGS